MESTIPTALLSESQLISSLKMRNHSAFSYLYDHYSGALYRIISQIITDQETAQDILQKVFVNIWQKIDNYETSKGRLFTWMLHIARNAAIDTLRSKSFRRQKLVHTLTEQDLPTHLETTWTKSDGIGLLHFVVRLKPQHRTLIEMFYFRGYSQTEIASLQEIPLSTIKTRMRAALVQLRGLLGEKKMSPM